MKKVILSLVIFILFLIAAFVLKTDVAVLLRGQGKNSLPLNNKTYLMKFRAPDTFSAMSVRFLTYNRPAGNDIVISIFNDQQDKKPLLMHIIKKNEILAHGQFYKFEFEPLKRSDSYFLQVKGKKGARYILRYNGKLGMILEDGQQKQGKIAFKLHAKRSISQITASASEKAAADWFRVGPAYLFSIVAYLIFVSLMLGTLFFRNELEHNEKT